MKIITKSTIFASVFILHALLNNAAAKTNYYEEALQSYNQQDIDAAFIHIKNALQENRKNLPAKLLLAKILIDKKSYALAEQELNDAINQGVDLNLIIAPLGRSMLLQGKFESVLLLADKKSLQPQGQLAFNLIKAQAYRALKDLDKAIALYDDILFNYENNVEAMLGLLAIHIYSTDFDKAKKLIKKLDLLALENSKLWQLKGMLARREKKYDDAILYFEKSLALNATNIITMRDLANSYREQKDFSKANQLIDKILELAPYDIQTQFTKSTLLKTLDQSKLGDQILIQLSDQLSSIDESYMISRPQLLLIDAMSSYAQEQWEQAQIKFKQYLVQEPDNEDLSAVILLAYTYIKLEQPDLALKLLSEHETNLIKNKDYALTLAGLYLQFGKTFKAEYLLSQLRKRYGDDEILLIFSAKVLAESGQPKQAFDLLERSKVTKGTNYIHTLAVLSLQLGYYDKSLQFVLSLTSSNPDNTEYQLLHSRVLLKLKQYQQAKELINDLYQKHPQDKDVRYSYALLQTSLGEHLKAKNILREIVTENPNDIDVVFSLAQVEYDLGNIKDAIAILERQTKVTANRSAALRKLAQINFEQQQFEATLKITNRLLANNRLDITVLLLKAKSLILLNRINEAKRQLNILTGLVGEDAKHLLTLSQLQRKVKDYKAAEYSLQLAYKLAPTALPIIVDNIKLKLYLKKFKAANAILVAAEKGRYKNNIYLIILKGDMADAKNNKQRAFDYYLTALKMDNTNTIALIKLSQVSQHKPRINKFTSYLTQLVNKYPERVFQRHTLADHLLKHKQFKQAKFHYQLLLTKNIPAAKRGIALNNLANIYIQEQDYENAIELAQQAIEALGSEPAIVDTLGWSLVLSGKLNEGLEYLRQAYTLSSTSPDIQYHIAYALVELERFSEAKTLLTQIMTLPDNFSEYSLAKKLLIKLK